MLRQTKHVGLTYTANQIQLAQEHRDTELITKASDYLLNTTGDTPLATAQLAGLRYRFLEDDTSGLQAVHLLQQVDPSAIATNDQDSIKQLLGWLSVIESVRSHPAWTDIQESWFDSLREFHQPVHDLRVVDTLWGGALDIGMGIVLEDETLFNRGADIYRLAINQHIHPEGYLKDIIDINEATDTYHLQVSGTCAFVLMAEMAEHVGIDLWSVNNRGITPVTATAYLLYYYYYPEKWKWGDDLTTEKTEALINTEGAFIEIVNRRNPLRGVDILLDDLRPLFGVYAGGLTTLTHGIPMPQKKKRWGLFG